MITVDYIFSFMLYSKHSGKEKASAEKIKYLSNATNLSPYTLNTISRNDNFKLVKMFFLEIYYMFHVIIIRKTKPELIFARSIFCFGSYLVSVFFKVPLVREVHSDILDESKILFANNNLKKRLSYLWHYYSLFFIKRSRGLIFNNPVLEKHYKLNYLGDRVKTTAIHNGCDPEFFYPINKIEARKRLGLKEKVVYLLFIGSVSKWHGVENILETQKYIEQFANGEKIVLLIVGGYDESYLAELKQQYEEQKIFFNGPVDKDTAFYYINAADLCLLPVNNIRISPGSPLKLFDYAACGKPVIAQEKTTGYSDLVEKYDLGISCDFTDPQNAAKKITAFLADFREDYYRQNNRKVAEEYFSWEKIIEKWIAFGLQVKGN